uniref:hypothetical protein n=1 Tax=Streptomyces chromofuscus TaxID=42881 RepID=UPI003570B0AB
MSVPQVAGSAVAAVMAAELASYAGVYGTFLGPGVVSVIATCGGSLFQQFFIRTGEQLRDVAAPARPAVQAHPVTGEFTEGTVRRTRGRARNRPLLAAAPVFGVTMTGVTAYELASGSSFSGGGTTVGDVLSGHGASSARDSGDTHSGSDSGSGSDSVPAGRVRRRAIPGRRTPPAAPHRRVTPRQERRRRYGGRFDAGPRRERERRGRPGHR